jgi:hypothetical protein
MVLFSVLIQDKLCKRLVGDGKSVKKFRILAFLIRHRYKRSYRVHCVFCHPKHGLYFPCY